MTTNRDGEEIRISGFDSEGNTADLLEFSSDFLGQHYPKQCPQGGDALGEPLPIRKIARLLGCSDWTVRHRYLPQGLPHFRPGPGGKIVFFRNQVIAWILQQQKQKGGR